MEEYYVYAIQSLQKDYLYVGMSQNPERRLKEHNRGKTRSTKPFRPYRLIYVEKVGSRKEARKREKYLKGGSGKEFLKKKYKQ